MGGWVRGTNSSTFDNYLVVVKRLEPSVQLLRGLGHMFEDRVQSAGFRVQGSGFRVQGLGVRVQGSGFRVQGSGFRVQGSGFRVQGSGFRVGGIRARPLRREGLHPRSSS